MSFDKTIVDGLLKNLDEEDTVAILVQPSPDPDCLGAAAGFSLILQEAYGLKSKIFHYGEVSHPQNRSMVNMLHLKLSKGEAFDLQDFAFTVVLDTDLTNTGFSTEDFTSADIRIDHHSMERDNGGSYEDVRLVGATCSIVWEWINAYQIDLSKHADVATALILGIKTDTLDFSAEGTNDLDYEAFRNIIPCVDRDKLARLTIYPLPKSVFEHEAKALKCKQIKNSVLVSSVGTLIPQKRDEIPIIADRFVRMDSIGTVVIMGLVENHLVASVRSTDSRVSVADLCAEVFGEEYSGAKEGSGGARVPLDSFGPLPEMTLSKEAKKVIEEELIAHYTDKIFESLGEE